MMGIIKRLQDAIDDNIPTCLPDDLLREALNTINRLIADRAGLVVIESPYNSNLGDQGISSNVNYARKAMRDCLIRGEYPLASHLLYTQPGILRDEIPVERALGIEAGLHWGQFAAKTVVYQDYGISGGMQIGIDRASAQGRPIEYRILHP